jgi:hypothetical protein
MTTTDSETDTIDAPTSEPAKKKPAYVAYNVREQGEGKKAKFTEIGVAFPHKDNKGFDILLDAMPFAGRITLRVLESK